MDEKFDKYYNWCVTKIKFCDFLHFGWLKSEAESTFLAAGDKFDNTLFGKALAKAADDYIFNEGTICFEGIENYFDMYLVCNDY